MADRKLVELPPGCMITDRRTWERQTERVAGLEARNRRLAEQLQGVRTANEALRRRIAEAEEVAIEQMAQAEEAEARAGRGRTASDKALKALRLSARAFERLRKSMGRSAYGGAVTEAHDAVREALRDAAKIG